MPNLAPFPVFVAAFLATLGSAIAQRLVGVSFNGTLVTVDPATGVGSPLGSLGFNWAGGLARIEDVLYTNDLGGALWKIDPWTGTSTAGPATSPVLNSIRAMTADRYGTLYVIQNGGGQISTTTPDQLYAVNPRTGAATLVGSTSTFVGIQGIAFRGNVLYGWDTNAGLVTISTATGATVDVNASIGATVDIQELACLPGGALCGARHNLYTIDTATGAPTLVGTGGYSDLRGIEYVHGPRIYDNGPVVTHPGGGFAGGDLSLLQTNLGLQYYGWYVDAPAQLDVMDDFQTNGPWLVDGFEFLFFHQGGPVPLSDVRLSIWTGPPGQGALVAGSPPPQVNLLAPGQFDVQMTLTDIYRASPTNPLAGFQRLQRIRILRSTPFVLDSATSPTGRFWLRFSADQPGVTLAVPPVTTLGLASPGNAVQFSGPAFQPLIDGGVGSAIPFRLFGTSQSPPAAITSLGGGCGAASNALSVRGATCAGGAVVHEFANAATFPGIVIGIGDPNLSLAPSCPCVLHANLDFVSLGQSRYDLVAPPGVGTGFEYRVQGLQLDFLGTAGLPCDLGLGFDLRLTDAYRVRFW